MPCTLFWYCSSWMLDTFSGSLITPLRRYRCPECARSMGGGAGPGALLSTTGGRRRSRTGAATAALAVGAAARAARLASTSRAGMSTAMARGFSREACPVRGEAVAREGGTGKLTMDEAALSPGGSVVIVGGWSGAADPGAASRASGWLGSGMTTSMRRFEFPAAAAAADAAAVDAAAAAAAAQLLLRPAALILLGLCACACRRRREPAWTEASSITVDRRLSRKALTNSISELDGMP